MFWFINNPRLKSKLSFKDRKNTILSVFNKTIESLEDLNTEIELEHESNKTTILELKSKNDELSKEGHFLKQTISNLKNIFQNE